MMIKIDEISCEMKIATCSPIRNCKNTLIFLLLIWSKGVKNLHNKYFTSRKYIEPNWSYKTKRLCILFSCSERRVVWMRFCSRQSIWVNKNIVPVIIVNSVYFFSCIVKINACFFSLAPCPACSREIFVVFLIIHNSFFGWICFFFRFFGCEALFRNQ